MKITVLAENTTSSPSLCHEHGLSLFIECNNKKILFDVGQTDIFSHNAEKLCVDLSGVDFTIISHGHYDHTGGLLALREINPTCPVYINENAFSSFYNGVEKYIGMPKDSKNISHIIRTSDYLKIEDGIELFTLNKQIEAFNINSFGLNVLRCDKYVADDFCHEQYLLIHEGNKKILISGCSHKGLINIMRCVQPDVFVGGFHYSKLDPAADSVTLDGIADNLLKLNCTFYTCHCTGVEQYNYLKTKLSNTLFYLSTGDIVEI